MVRRATAGVGDRVCLGTRRGDRESSRKPGRLRHDLPRGAPRAIAPISICCLLHFRARRPRNLCRAAPATCAFALAIESASLAHNNQMQRTVINKVPCSCVRRAAADLGRYAADSPDTSVATRATARRQWAHEGEANAPDSEARWMGRGDTAGQPSAIEASC